MPPPGLPEWLGPGALLQERSTSRIHVVRNVTIQPPNREALGLYVITLVQEVVGSNALESLLHGEVQGTLQETGTWNDTATHLHLNLPALLAQYEWTGHYLTPDGEVVDGRQLAAAVELGPIGLVDANQVWLLPAPNVGLWRTSWETSQIVLTHVREADRIMRCTAGWLESHGVRQDPPDPRTELSGQPVVLGQVWEIPTDRHQYKNVLLWRVHTIEGERVILMASDGSGKRLYWTTSILTRVGTYAGDGIPRRTAFERVLEDD